MSIADCRLITVVQLVRGENERHVGAIACREARGVERQTWADLDLRRVN